MHSTIRYLLAYTSFVFWLILGLYFGLAGILYADLMEEKTSTIQQQTTSEGDAVYMYDGVPFSSYEKAQMHQQEQDAQGLFKWFTYLPSKLILFITSMALGGLGGVIGMVKELALTKVKIVDLKPFWRPMLGALIGLLVLGLSYLLPVVLTTATEVEIRSTTLIFVSMFAGLYARQFLQFLEARFSTYLNKIDEA